MPRKSSFFRQRSNSQEIRISSGVNSRTGKMAREQSVQSIRQIECRKDEDAIDEILPIQLKRSSLFRYAQGLLSQKPVPVVITCEYNAEVSVAISPE